MGAKEAPASKFLRMIPGLGHVFNSKFLGWLIEHAERYDIVILNGLWNYTSVGSWRALHRLTTPYFVFTHGMLDPYFSKRYPIKGLIKSIAWKLFEHKVLRDANGVLFTTEEELALAAQAFRPYRARELVVGYGARDVEGDRESFRSALAAKVPGLRDRKYVLYLSRIHPKKGVDLLIRAFARVASKYPDLDVLIAGPDQVGLSAQLQRLAQQEGIADRIHWPGMLTGEAKWGAFSFSEFFALPSHQENFGIVVAEALALGTPVLITNKVNIWRDIETDQAGVVVNDDVDGIAFGLEHLCAKSDAERAVMGSNARRCFLDRYDWQRTAMHLLDIMGQNRARPAAQGSPLARKAH